jgi:signal transduction histidine kinase/ligand-binding sensor domain-containing protein
VSAQTKGGSRGAILFLLLLAVSRSSLGLDPDRTIEQFFHTTWTVSDGAPSGITQMVQTTDGYLWLATQTGLIRFDGVRFLPYEPANRMLPSHTIASLLATPDGGLWMGFVPSGAAFLKGGQLVTYDQSSGLPTAPVYALGRDGEGTVWLGTTRGLMRLEGATWRAIGSDWGFPEITVDSFFLDHQGRFWVSTIEGLFCLPPHARSFERNAGRSVRLAETKDGTLWMAENRTPLRPFPPSKSVIELEGNQILIDRDDSMWVVTYGDGLARIPNPAKLTNVRVPSDSRVIQRFAQKDGLSDNRVTSVLEDQEGNLWMGTKGGLDRFRRRNVVSGPFPYGSDNQDLAVIADRAGSIWAGNIDQPLMQFQGNKMSFRGGKQRISCAYRGSDGTLWFGGENSLTRLAGDRLETIPLPHQVDPALQWRVQALTQDPAGGVWVSVSQNGIFRLDRGVWTQWGGVAALAKRTAVILFTDPAGRVWFGYTGNAVAVLDKDTVRTFSAPEGLQVGTVTAIGQSHGRIWVGGQFGLAVFDGNRFTMVVTEAGGFKDVSGIVETANGDLWVNQGNGLAHISSAEVEATLKDVLHRMHGEIFDFQDGVLGTASPIRPLPSAILANDGRVWLSGTNGVSWIDPSRIYKNPLAPPVSVEAIYADGQHYEASTSATLPVLPSNVRIEYTALSLSVPERVRFRYRLEGFDKGWQDAGTRRAAFYTGLGPGRYHFHVIACNNDGVWNEAGAIVDLIVPPAFYQTAWFTAFCITAAGGLLWMLYLLRLRQMAAQMQSRLAERLAERERIARELHDTLLQGIQGMILRFQAATNRISASDPVRGLLEQALDGADEVMVEGRERVRDLRAHAHTALALSQAFSLVGEELLQDHPRTAFRVVVDGAPRELHLLVRDEAYRIGREALLNAFSHSGARRIEVELTYKRAELQLQFRDDGSGIDPKILGLGRPGHWGLTGMRERAEKMGARLDIRSGAGAGTEIELRISSALAYRDMPGGSLLRWPWRIKPKERIG